MEDNSNSIFISNIDCTKVKYIHEQLIQLRSHVTNVTDIDINQMSADISSIFSHATESSFAHSNKVRTHRIMTRYGMELIVERHGIPI